MGKTVIFATNNQHGFVSMNYNIIYLEKGKINRNPEAINNFL